jgi:molybdopterin synthase catalytic subunit
MAEKELSRIEAEVTRRWAGVRIRIVHRTGALRVGETSVLIAVATPHRAEGFDALRFAIESVKRTAPVWKKEIYPDGYAWIEGS